jgi:hypothetical protein
VTRRYYGHAGHFIASDGCRFHLCTEVNDRYRVSTVGDYRPRGAMVTAPPTEVGYGRLYETMVFSIGADGEVDDWAERECFGYQTAEEADAGHEAMCRKYEEK